VTDHPTDSATGPTSEIVAELRKICLAFPEATEKPFGGHEAPAFRVRDKLFVTLAEDGSALTLKASAGEQALLVSAEPDRFFVPAYVGSKGWIGIVLRLPVDWEEVAEFIEDSYRLIAPKSLVSRLDAERGA
jgi:predicted DNA-binding protein (MmcQ/YjbR family)